MTKYLDDTGLEHFFDNIKDLTRGPSYQQVASYLNAHPESLNDPVADYIDEHPTATIPDGSITTDKLANNSVTAAKLANGAITLSKLDLTFAASIPMSPLTDAEIDAITEA